MFVCFTSANGETIAKNTTFAMRDMQPTSTPRLPQPLGANDAACSAAGSLHQTLDGMLGSNSSLCDSRFIRIDIVFVDRETGTKNSALINTMDTGETLASERNDTATPQNTV